MGDESQQIPAFDGRHEVNSLGAGHMPIRIFIVEHIGELSNAGLFLVMTLIGHWPLANRLADGCAHISLYRAFLLTIGNKALVAICSHTLQIDVTYQLAMGKQSHSSHAAVVASKRSPEAATPTGFLTLVVSQLSLVVMLIRGVMGVLRMAQKSKCEELVGYGENADKMGSQLVSAFLGFFDALTRISLPRELIIKGPAVASWQISLIIFGGVLTLIRRLFLKKPRPGWTRAQVANALRLSRVPPLFELLRRDLDTPTGIMVTETPEPGLPETLSNSSDLLVNGPPRVQESEAPQTVEPSHDPLPLLPQPNHEPQPNTPRAGTRGSGHRRPPIPTRRAIDLKAGEIILASMTVERLRRSARHNPSPMKIWELAGALGHYSDLLAQEGRTAEALEARQESTRWYRDLAEGKHQPRYNTN